MGSATRSTGCVSAYEAMFVLKDAIERAGSIDKEALVAALTKTNLPVVRGTLRFDQNHQVVYGYDPKTSVLGCWVQWQNGNGSPSSPKLQLPAKSRCRHGSKSKFHSSDGVVEYWSNGDATVPDALVARERERTRLLLDRLLAEAGLPKRALLLRTGAPADAIEAVVDQENVGVLVLGSMTHGRSVGSCSAAPRRSCCTRSRATCWSSSPRASGRPSRPRRATGADWFAAPGVWRAARAPGMIDRCCAPRPGNPT